MAATLGRTRYGLGVTFANTQESEKTSKTYNGFNFQTSNPALIANQSALFVRGGTYNEVTYPGLAGLLAEGYQIDAFDVIARNQVNGTVSDNG